MNIDSNLYQKRCFKKLNKLFFETSFYQFSNVFLLFQFILLMESKWTLSKYFLILSLYLYIIL